MKWRWNPNEVHPIEEDKSKFGHVVKHFYRREEHWAAIAPGAATSRSALRAGCKTVDVGPRADYDRACGDCRIHVVSVHDQHYGPLYLEELESALASGRFGTHDSKTTWCFVGDKGVAVFANEVDRQTRVKVRTAYRVIPRSSDRSIRAFRDAAVRKLADKSSFKSGDHK